MYSFHCLITSVFHFALFSYVLFQSTSQSPKTGIHNQHTHDTEGSSTKPRFKHNSHHLLLKDLLENYDLRVRPVVNYSHAVNVSVRLTLHLIRELVSIACFNSLVLTFVPLLVLLDTSQKKEISAELSIIYRFISSQDCISRMWSLTFKCLCKISRTDTPSVLLLKNFELIDFTFQKRSNLWGAKICFPLCTYSTATASKMCNILVMNTWEWRALIIPSFSSEFRSLSNYISLF